MLWMLYFRRGSPSGIASASLIGTSLSIGPAPGFFGMAFGRAHSLSSYVHSFRAEFFSSFRGVPWPLPRGAPPEVPLPIVHNFVPSRSFMCLPGVVPIPLQCNEKGFGSLSQRRLWSGLWLSRFRSCLDAGLGVARLTSPLLEIRWIVGRLPSPFYGVFSWSGAGWTERGPFWQSFCSSREHRASGNFLILCPPPSWPSFHPELHCGGFHQGLFSLRPRPSRRCRRLS